MSKTLQQKKLYCVSHCYRARRTNKEKQSMQACVPSKVANVYHSKPFFFIIVSHLASKTITTKEKKIRKVSFLLSISEQTFPCRPVVDRATQTLELPRQKRLTLTTNEAND